ncbi:efflux RND transporter periplasmic adaptor subunit [Desulfovibrio sp. UIB00]|uniref:efflux RND transporter periplasmic adaptor subunit n=1 Tax=Desulfovibrio sp. UIB00 TaxID=2804314 RepID=UPI001F113CAC|nr:efflux RND transporter periplasmic adaptor subunit [Desulfovibrio sp. UIB00]MCH5145524.1 efflux RND transporter periplasmic adaptor subunit [Desulfovibrio sp. UIB00]
MNILDIMSTKKLLKKNYVLIIIGAIILIIGGALVGSNESKRDDAPAYRRVRSYTVITASTNTAEYTGVIRARTESNLGFRVAGKITEKLVKDGDHVIRGQALMRLDPTDIALGLAASKEAVTAAKAQNRQALADERRMRNLLSEKAVSTKDYDHARALADATTAQLSAAIANAKQMENQVDYALLRADADGIIMETVADVGQVVNTGAVVVRLAHDGAREAVINFPEGDAKASQHSAVASLYAAQGKIFPAELRELSAQADPITRTYQARYTLKEEGKDAPLGATVTVRLERDESSGGAQLCEIPIGALFDDGSGISVWVISPETSTLSRRPVVVVKLGSETALISKGLELGEQILALGAHLVSEGEHVQPQTNTAEKKYDRL